MADWKQLERDLSSWLKDRAIPPLEYRGSFQAIPGFPSDGFRSDGLLTDGRVLLALEVEAGQNHPDTNVGKYWLLSQYHTYERIILFHVYTPDFNSYGWRKALGEFYADKMKPEVPIDYTQLDYRAATDYGSTFSGICSKMEDRMESEFSSIFDDAAQRDITSDSAKAALLLRR